MRDRKLAFLDNLFAIFVANSVDVYFREVVVDFYNYSRH